MTPANLLDPPSLHGQQGSGMGVHVCKSVCIEVKIIGRRVSDHRNLVLRFALLTQHNQQPPVHLFSPLYTRTYIHEPPFLNADGQLLFTIKFTQPRITHQLLWTKLPICCGSHMCLQPRLSPPSPRSSGKCDTPTAAWRAVSNQGCSSIANFCVA